eukprot:Tamp_22728.p1 GENE.Tamp_22728~~Tamp_22728.p1  ORF type:complete len:282 (-),score=23.69 Tamp_22728:33-878(-)
MAAAAASLVPRFKAVLFGIWGVVTMPAQRASEHVRRWEATKGLPSGFLLARSAVEGGAVHLVLDGQINTIEGGSLLYNEILEEGIQASPDLTPMHLSGQLRRMQEKARVHPEIASYLQTLRTAPRRKHSDDPTLNPPYPATRRPQPTRTLLLCERWHQVACARVGCGCGCARCRREEAETPAQRRSKAEIASNFHHIFEGALLRGGSKRMGEGVRGGGADPQLFLAVCREIGVPPQEMVYVDRSAVSLANAASVGLTPLPYCDTPASTITSLDTLLRTYIE